MNYFKHRGVQPNTEEFTEDLFADLDQEDEELDELVQQIDPDIPLTVREYATADEDVATCATFENSANWRQGLQDMVVSQGHCSKMPAIIKDDKDEESEELPVDVINHYYQAIRRGNDMLAFLTKKRGRTVIKHYVQNNSAFPK